jgi:VWFA-related protein
MATRERTYFLITLLLGILLLVMPVGAQSPEGITVIDQLVIEEANSLTLDVYFTTPGEDDSSAPRNQVQSATIVLEDGSQYEAQVQKPPYFIALVLDASGSMKDVFEEVRSAAIDAIREAPSDVHFAVIRFDDNIDLIQPFTNDHGQLVDAVNRIKIGDSGTCLYDIAYTAVEVLEQVARNAPRRAMLLFTDGQDEIKRGISDACSQNTFDQLISFATNRNVPVPIHTVGFASSQRRINSTELRDLSRATGGQSAIGDSAVLSELYRQIMADVNRQWMVQAELHPTQGFHRGALYVTLADGSLPLSGPVLFTTTRSYQTPPEPVTIEIGNFTYNETADLFFLYVALTSFRNVGSLHIEILDSQNNVQVDREIFDNPTVSQQIRLDTNSLKAGREYVARVFPRSLEGNNIKGEDGESLFAAYRFRYEPHPEPLILSIDSIQIKDEEPSLNIRTWQIEDDEAELTFNLSTENGEQIARFEGRLISQQSNLEEVSEFSRESAAETILIPLQVGAGSYTIVVDALAQDVTRLATARSTFTYIPPEEPITRALMALQANPIVNVAAIALLIIAALIALVIGVLWGRRIGKSSARQARETDVFKMAQKRERPTEARDVPLVRIRVVASPDESLVNGSGLEVTRFPFTIGREECDLTIPGDRHVSRKHAKITFENGVFYIEDSGSSNGTFVNDAPIAANEPTPLSTDIGAKIRIGKTTNLTFSEAIPHEEPPVPEPEAVQV